MTLKYCNLCILNHTHTQMNCFHVYSNHGGGGSVGIAILRLCGYIVIPILSFLEFLGIGILGVR